MSVGLSRLREEPDVLRRGAEAKGEDARVVDAALELDERRRALLADGDALKAERNAASRRVGEAVRGGADPGGPEVAELKVASARAGERIAAIDAERAAVDAALDDAMLRIPNPPDPDVPVGGEDANVVVRAWGECLPRTADGWERLPHWALGEGLGIIDNARGAKVTGSGFPVYVGAGAALQRALIGWFMDLHAGEHGMTEVWPPAVVNAESARGTGQIPDKEDQ
ncbi:MAG TPA: serine--tRNA ligase, partial [Candidatus Limnocylindria bacterium]|nr:serine--tRNA ligase [Candidatus Limnocylindria bacterium]